MKRLLLSLAVIFTALSLFACASPPKRAVLSYDETTDALLNPERGFYSTLTVTLNADGALVPETEFKRGLMRLQVSLENFSNTDPLTLAALEALAAVLERMRAGGTSAIPVFSYDGFAGQSDKEPQVSTVLTHIRQLKSIFYDYSDIIALIEVGFLGAYGSFNGGSLVNDTNLKLIVNELLAATDGKTYLSVRSPYYYYNRLGLGLSDLINLNPEKYSDEARVGVFDDSYLSSEDDNGVFTDRNAERTWLFRHANNAFFGGIAHYNEGGGKVSSKAEYILSEMQLMHVSYLSLSSDHRTLEAWKNTPVSQGLYAGKSAYEQIENTLGYRLVLRDSTISETASAGDKLNLSLALENTGCAPVIKRKTAQIVLSGKGGDYIYDVPLDITAVKGGSKSDFSFPVTLDKEMVSGSYQVYLRLACGETSYRSAIRFANVSTQWNETLCANKIGEIEIK